MYPYHKLVIYYFSGTGNAQNVARWVGDLATRRGMEVDTVSIARTDRQHPASPPPGALVLFVSPTHGFNFPPVMLHFLLRFPRGANHSMLMNTRAGMRLGNWVVPGISGIALWLAAAILVLKGYRLRGMVPVDLPSNWISLHPGLNQHTVAFLHNRNKIRVLNQSGKVLAGFTNFRALRDVVQDTLVAPVAVLYYLMGRFLLAKTFYASASCNHCGVCIQNCPVKAIVQKDGRPYWTLRCESCMKCMSDCPQKAIETAHGFVAIVVLVNGMLLVPWFFSALAGLGVSVHATFLSLGIEYILWLVLWVGAYRLLYFLTRYRWADRLVTYTSFTKYKWWGRRYKALRKSV